MKLYIAGPMRGIPEFNFPAFHAAAARLRAADHLVFNPAEVDEAGGFDATGLKGDLSEAGDFSLRTALAGDLVWICLQADAVITLPGWAQSRGATAEVHTAYALDIPVYPLETFLIGNPQLTFPLIVK